MRISAPNNNPRLSKGGIAMSMLLAVLLTSTGCNPAIPDNGVERGIAVIEEALRTLETSGFKITHISDFENSEMVDFIGRRAEDGIPMRGNVYPGAGIVERILVEGDFGGEDIGKTNAVLYFKLLRITIQQVAGCKESQADLGEYNTRYPGAARPRRGPQLIPEVA